MSLDHIKDDKGQLPSFAWPGGYPIFYMDGDNCILCPKCANKFANDEQVNFRPVAFDINWEDPSMICEQCNERIPSAYAED